MLLRAPTRGNSDKSSQYRAYIGCVRRNQWWGQLGWADADNKFSSRKWANC
ncbi:hypothetical protein [Streptomyces daliensis]|uniref:Uncharacterized protein n=1 Tax=Streptomyces daliensis TaxID=299421 RepID=A0A8T4II81_9ACTN|nr:hypothetical protein [Streptomyces daliensis]